MVWQAPKWLEVVWEALEQPEMVWEVGSRRQDFTDKTFGFRVYTFDRQSGRLRGQPRGQSPSFTWAPRLCLQPLAKLGAGFGPRVRSRALSQTLGF